jgi:hypothetical protein
MKERVHPAMPGANDRSLVRHLVEMRAEAEVKIARYEQTLRAIMNCELVGAAYVDWVHAACVDALQGEWPECWGCGTTVHDGLCVQEDSDL